MKRFWLRFLKIRIVHLKGELSNVEDFAIQWGIKFIPIWFYHHTKEFGVRKVKVFESHGQASKYVWYRIEKKKISAISNV